MEEQTAHTENKMGTMPINRLLITMSLPIMFSMLVQALYNIVDSIFVSFISENALTAVSLAFPIQNLMIAVGAGTGVGINALLSKQLGSKNFDEVNKAANNGVFLSILSAVVFMVWGILFSRSFFQGQTDNPEIVEYGYQYLLVCCTGSIGIFCQITFERLLQSTGRTIYSMIIQVVGAVINLVLDPILIFGLLGFPKLGVTGAALATIIGQIAAMFLGLYFNRKFNQEIKLSFQKFRPSGATIKRIYSVGVPSIVMSSIGSVMVLGMNTILMVFTSTATAVMGVYFKLQSFIFMPIFGLTNGIVPILAYNYGAQNRQRMIRTIQLGVIYSVSIMVLGLMAFQLFAGNFLAMFNASEEMMEIGVVALRTISPGFVLAGFGIIASTTFQTLGHGLLSLTVSAVRQLVVLLPAAYLLAKTNILQMVWFAFPIAEIVAVILCAFFLWRVYHNVILPVGQENSQS